MRRNVMRILLPIGLLLVICSSHVQARSLAEQYEESETPKKKREYEEKQLEEDIARRVQAEGHIVLCEGKRSFIVGDEPGVNFRHHGAISFPA